MMEQLLRDLGGKPLASGVFSWWDVGQTPWPCPSSITVRKYLVFKCHDRAATGLSSWSLGPATCHLWASEPPSPREVSQGHPEASPTVEALFGYPKGCPREIAFGVSS